MSLRLVADGGRLVPQVPAQRADVAQVPAQRMDVRREPVRTQAVPRTVTERTPVRLTRRGRLVVTAAAALTIGVASMALAGAAQATGHSRATAGPGAAVTRVEVRSGQSLWSLAEAYDPDADTRLVIQDILQMNSLASDQIQPGQVLWVPRG